MPVKSAFFMLSTKFLHLFITLTRPSFLYVDSQVCQHSSTNGAPWNRYPLGRNFRQGFCSHFRTWSTSSLSSSKRFPASSRFSGAKEVIIRWCEGLVCVVGVAKSPIHISLANLGVTRCCVGCSVVVLQNDPRWSTALGAFCEWPP